MQTWVWYELHTKVVFQFVLFFEWILMSYYNVKRRVLFPPWYSGLIYPSFFCIRLNHVLQVSKSIGSEQTLAMENRFLKIGLSKRFMLYEPLFLEIAEADFTPLLLTFPLVSSSFCHVLLTIMQEVMFLATINVENCAWQYINRDVQLKLRSKYKDNI